jgi:hypothetical protein
MPKIRTISPGDLGNQIYLAPACRAHGQRAKYLFQNDFRLLKDFVIPKTQDPYPAAFEHGGPMNVIGGLPVDRVPSTIDFYRELGRGTVEVEDEISDNMLATKFVADKLPVT